MTMQMAVHLHRARAQSTPCRDVVCAILAPCTIVPCSTAAVTTCEAATEHNSDLTWPESKVCDLECRARLKGSGRGENPKGREPGFGGWPDLGRSWLIGDDRRRRRGWAGLGAGRGEAGKRLFTKAGCAHHNLSRLLPSSQFARLTLRHRCQQGWKPQNVTLDCGAKYAPRASQEEACNTVQERAGRKTRSGNTKQIQAEESREKVW